MDYLTLCYVALSFISTGVLFCIISIFTYICYPIKKRIKGFDPVEQVVDGETPKSLSSSPRASRARLLHIFELVSLSCLATGACILGFSVYYFQYLPPPYPPCWDANANGVCDPSEDWNVDGVCTVADCDPNNIRDLEITRTLTASESISTPIVHGTKLHAIESLGVNTIPDTVYTMKVIGTSQIIGSSTVVGNSYVTHNSTIDGHQYIIKSLHVNGAIGFGTAPSQEYLFKVGGNTYVTTNLTVAKRCTAQDMRINGLMGINTEPDQLYKLKVGGNTQVSTDLTVGGNTQITTDLTVGRNAQVSSNLTVSKRLTTRDLRANGLIGINTEPDQSYKLKVGGNARITTTLKSDTVEVDTRVLTKDLKTTGQTGLKIDPDPRYTLKVGGDTYISGDLVVNQNITAGDVAQNVTIIAHGGLSINGYTSTEFIPTLSQPVVTAVITTRFSLLQNVRSILVRTGTRLWNMIYHFLVVLSSGAFDITPRFTLPPNLNHSSILSLSGYASYIKTATYTSQCAYYPPGPILCAAPNIKGVSSLMPCFCSFANVTIVFGNVYGPYCQCSGPVSDAPEANQKYNLTVHMTVMTFE